MALAKKDKYPRFCKQGKTYKDAFGFSDSNREPLDLTGYSARMEVRRSLPTSTSTAGDSEVIVSLSTDNGMITIDAGVVYMEIDAETTATFEVGSYFWELELVRDSDGYIPTIMEPSAFKVTQEITLND